MTSKLMTHFPTEVVDGGLMSHQFKLPGFDGLLPEVSAARYVGLDLATFRDLRRGHWQGFVPYQRINGRIYYLRADLDGWLANNAQRNAGKKPGKFSI